MFFFILTNQSKKKTKIPCESKTSKEKSAMCYRPFAVVHQNTKFDIHLSMSAKLMVKNLLKNHTNFNLNFGNSNQVSQVLSSKMASHFKYKICLKILCLIFF